MPSKALTASFSRPTGYAAAGDNIPFLVDGAYHLFQLSSPPNTIHHPSRLRCAWTRQRSKDLVNWTRDETPVISPGKEDADCDRDGAWTGSAVIGPDGNMHIFYTGYILNGRQVILHAKSSDRQGTKFEKPRSPIALDATSTLSKFEATDFRDPYVFYHEPENQFWMLVATRLVDGPYWTRGCIALLTSPDLETWTVESEPLYSPNNIFCPECPELFTLGNGKWYLLYSRFSAPYAGTLYTVGDSPRGPFHLPRDCSGGRLDGRRWYAAKSCPRSGDASKRIAFGWVHDRCEDDGKWLWGGTTVLPREYSARPDGTLRCDPLPEVLGIMERAVSPINGTISANLSLTASGVVSIQSLPISQPPPGTTTCLSFTLSRQNANSFGLLLDYDDDMRGYRISLEHVAADTYQVALICDLSPLDDFWSDLTNHSIPKLVDGPELVRHGAVNLDQPMRLMRSEDIVELFVGGKVITYRLSPRRELAVSNCMANGVQLSVQTTPVGLFVEDGEVHFESVSFFSLNSHM